jgi:hypothetical protein
VISSWALTGSEFNTAEQAAEVSYYTPNPTWNLDNFSVSERDEKEQRFSYLLAKEAYKNVVGTLSITRRPLYFMVNGVFPNLILNILTLLAFGLPTASQFALSNFVNI